MWPNTHSVGSATKNIAALRCSLLKGKKLQHPLDLQSGHFLSEAPCTFLRFLNPHNIHLFEIFVIGDYMLFRKDHGARCFFLSSERNQILSL